MKHCNSRG